MRLTRRQATVLATLECRDRMTAADMGVRSDVLWRLEERGLVARNAHEQWHIRQAAKDALAATGEENRT